MKRLLTVIFIVLTSISANGQFFEFDELMSKKDIQDLKIKTVHIYERTITDTTLTQKMTFDKNGNLTGDNWYQVGYKDSITKKSTFKYDSDGNETSSSHCIWLGTGFDFEDPDNIQMELVCSNYKSTYENGRLMRMDGDSGAYITNGINFKEYEYDDKGNLVKVLSHDTIDKETEWVIYIYDENNKRQQYNSYENDGRLKYFQVYHYDDNGQLIEVNCKNTGKDKEVQEDFHYKYNEKGKRIQWDRYGFWTKKPTSHFYKYDLKGQLIQFNVDGYMNLFEYEYY